jgi:flagellar protein FliL
MADKKEKGKGNGLKIVIIVLLVIIVLGLGFGGAYFFLNKNSENSKGTTTIPTANNLNQTMPNSAVQLSSYTYSMDEFLVNLADEGGKRFFKVKLFIGYEPTKKKEKNMLAELEEKKPIIRDVINSVLRAKKSTDLATQQNVDDLKKELLTRMAPYFENGRVNNIYFNDILIQ